MPILLARRRCRTDCDLRPGLRPGVGDDRSFRSARPRPDPGHGLLAACVPGAFGAWLTLLRDWGTLPAQVLEPAIGYALSGHPILASTVETIRSVRDLFLAEWHTSAAIISRTGEPPAGALFANPTLGELYSRSRACGGAASEREAQIEAALDYWYKGPVAEAIGRFCRTTEALDVSGRVIAA